MAHWHEIQKLDDDSPAISTRVLDVLVISVTAPVYLLLEGGTVLLDVIYHHM